MVPSASPIRRNDPCPCGSGRRYKDCCGRLAPAIAEKPPTDVSALMREGLAAQQGRRFDEAERLYRSVLERVPDEADTLHMLGVVRYELGDDDDALALILRALDRSGWKLGAFRHNLGLVLAHRNRAAEEPRLAQIRRRYEEWRTRPLPAVPDLPRVSVVVPSFNHARYLERALRSVFEQTHRDVELIVVDDGSTDSSPDITRRMLADCPFEHRLVTRGNRGAAATINEGVSLATSAWINILNSDDVFAPDRLETMLREVSGRGAQWGFSGVACIDADDAPADPLRDSRAFVLTCGQAAVPFRETIGFALVVDNVAVSSGNLLFSRDLFDRVGGFRELRYNHDWDFCLRALATAEPIYASGPLYRYRLHGGNTIAESAARARDEANDVLRPYLDRAMRADVSLAPFAPSVANWGSRFVIALLESGMGQLLDPAQLRDLALAVAASPKHTASLRHDPPLPLAERG
jgi:glycosyltransferase involved in cell wall biosynthesis